MVHRWLFLGEAAPVTLAGCLFRRLTKMDRDLFLLKIDSNWAVYLHAFPRHEDLSQSAVSPAAPAGFLSRPWPQREFFGLGFSCPSPDVLRFVDLCLGHWPLFWLLFNRWSCICSLVKLAQKGWSQETRKCFVPLILKLYLPCTGILTFRN